LEGEGSSSNRETQAAPLEVAEAAAASTSSSSSSESGKISGLDWSASSRESGSTSSTSSSDESNDSGSGGYVEIMLSDTDAEKRAVNMEEGENGEESDAAGAEESEESLTGVKADLQDLVKKKTCFMGQSLMTQANLDALRLEGSFEPGVCRLPRKETTLKPRKNDSVVFRDFFTAGLRLQVSKRFAERLAAYNVQIHQLTPNSFPQITKFLWACRTFAGDNDVEIFVHHFEIHWAKRVINVEDEENEAQYECCTFQTRHLRKDQAPVELAPAHKNKWANRWTSYWFYAPIPVIGRNAKREEVTTYYLASRMVDLDVDLSPELTKVSRSSASTSAYFQVSHVIMTRDALEEFVAAEYLALPASMGLLGVQDSTIARAGS
jgi:hypothetical protein